MQSGNLVSGKSDQVGDGAPSNLVTKSGQVTEITRPQRVIMPMCQVPRSLAELQNSAKYGSRSYFKSKVVNPLLDNGLLRMTKPEKPRAKDQKYVLTGGGLRLVLLWKESSEQVDE